MIMLWRQHRPGRIVHHCLSSGSCLDGRVLRRGLLGVIVREPDGDESWVRWAAIRKASFGPARDAIYEAEMAAQAARRERGVSAEAIRDALTTAVAGLQAKANQAGRIVVPDATREAIDALLRQP